jgi:hypothetical protein
LPSPIAEKPPPEADGIGTSSDGEPDGFAAEGEAEEEPADDGEVVTGGLAVTRVGTGTAGETIEPLADPPVDPLAGGTMGATGAGSGEVGAGRFMLAVIPDGSGGKGAG